MKHQRIYPADWLQRHGGFLGKLKCFSTLTAKRFLNIIYLLLPVSSSLPVTQLIWLPFWRSHVWTPLSRFRKWIPALLLYIWNLCSSLNLLSKLWFQSLDDLSKQYKILYAPLNGSSAMTYFQRMSDIEKRFYEIWKDMSLNDSLTPVQRSKLAVWDYPVSDKYTKMWQAMFEAGLPSTLEEAVEKVR